MSNDGLAKLELLAMDQERTLDQFGDLLRDQQAQITKLEQRLQMLEQKLSKYAETADVQEHHEPPPHY